jgi:phosphohistidine phosphatase
MKLYFLRHAEASYDAPTDHDRPLTPHGIERTEVAARVMHKLGIAPQHIFSSPRLRAEQTAEIVAKALGEEVEINEEVNFNFSVESVITLLGGLGDDADEVMFVGHNPSMSEVVSLLTGAELSLKKGGLARVDVSSAASLDGELVWLIAPKLFDILIKN